MVSRNYTAEEISRNSKVVSMRQARLALLEAGKLADIETAIASLPSSKEAVQNQWELLSNGRAFSFHGFKH